jgi:hypothetical protein
VSNICKDIKGESDMNNDNLNIVPNNNDDESSFLCSHSTIEKMDNGYFCLDCGEPLLSIEFIQ